MKRFKPVVCVMIFFFQWALFLLPAVSAEERLQVAVSILPQKYFVEKIGGDRVKVSVMVLPGSSPATYEPKPRQMANLTKAAIYFAVGVPFETVWLEKFRTMNPKMAVVPTQAGIEKIPMKAHVHDSHETKTHPEHAAPSGIKDPHVWLSPPLVMLQARNILNGFIEVDPKYKASYQANYKEFIGEVANLDIQLINQFQGTVRSKSFMVYHPSWGYFARAYGLRQIPIEMEGKGPTAREMRELVDMARANGIKVIFVQPQFSTKRADTIAKTINGSFMVADPLAENWAENLLKVAKAFRSTLTP